MSVHVLRFTIDGVSRFDEVDAIVARRVRHWTGWDETACQRVVDSDACHVNLTATGDPPVGRARQRFRAEVEVYV